jgi:DnaJ domain
MSPAANDSDTPPLPTYTTLPTKTTCPNAKCGKDLYYYPPTQINNVRAPVLLTCVVCAHCFPTSASLDVATDKLATLSIKRSHYEVLGVERTASADEIARAYRKKSLLCHPDRTKGREEEWDLLTKAYDVLGDNRKRHWYDIELEKGPSASAEPSEDPNAQGISPPPLY